MVSNLITPEEVINFAFTNGATDPALIKDEIINIAQEEHIRSAIGNTLKLTDSFYEQLVTQNTNNTLTAVNEALLEDYLKPCLAFYVKLEMLHDMNINTTSKGLMVNNSETSRSATTSEIQQFANKVQSHADTLRDKMLRYMNDEDNIDNFPLYRDGFKKQTSQVGGIIFDEPFDAVRFNDYPGKYE